MKQRAKADQGDGVTKRERSRREGGVRLAQEGRTFYLFEKEDGGPFAVQGGVRQPAVHHGRPNLPADPGVTTPSCYGHVQGRGDVQGHGRTRGSGNIHVYGNIRDRGNNISY